MVQTMTDRDKLIKLLDRFTDDHNSWKDDELADYLLANGVIVPPEWISVKDRLPKEDGMYLGYFKSGYMYIAYFAKNLEKVDKYDFYKRRRKGWYQYDSEWGHCERDDVTHWMPLPNMPKECEQNAQG